MPPEIEQPPGEDKPLTAGDISDRYEDLSEFGAQLLGKIMYAFGHLEHALALAVRYVDGGKQLNGSSFHARLAAFERALDATFQQRWFDRRPYDAWIEGAHGLREIRNDMVHGRWVPDPRTITVQNVIVSADLREERVVAYPLVRLQDIAAEVTQLQRELGELIERHEL